MKDTLNSPQVVAALITSVVAIILALMPTLLENNESSASVQESALTTAFTPEDPTSEAVAVDPTDTVMPTQTVAATVIIPTDTNAPTNLPPTVPPATNTPTEAAPPNVILMFDDVSFTAHNQTSRSLAFDKISFESSSGRWDAEQWGIGLVESFPADSCLRMRDATSGNRQPPAVCGELRGLQLTAGSTLFWLDTDEFTVMMDGALIATCATASDTCEVFVPSS